MLVTLRHQISAVCPPPPYSPDLGGGSLNITGYGLIFSPKQITLMSQRQTQTGRLPPLRNPNIMKDAILEYNSILLNRKLIVKSWQSDIFKLYPDFVISCHPFQLQIKESSKDIGWKLLEVNATVFGTHKISRTEEKGSRNVSFYIKFSVLEVGHAISKKANWDMQQSKVFVDVSLSNYKKIWKTLFWHLCKKSNSFKFLKI